MLQICFVAFFVGTAFALAFHRHRYVKRSYIAGFLVVFLVVNLTGLAVLPMMHWHKFSEPRPESQTHHSVRLVTAEGEELSYPTEATLSADSISFSAVTRKMRTEYSPAQNRRLTRYLLVRARDHRQAARHRSALQYLRFPPHGFLGSWDEATIRSDVPLVGLRLYRTNLTTSPDGTEVRSRSETLLKGFYPGCEGTQAAAHFSTAPCAFDASTPSTSSTTSASFVISTSFAPSTPSAPTSTPPPTTDGAGA
ncbi:hypothetical protein [Halococcus hamelinensis]|uniref:hypothetical protein n=1 Tax=Halococcus hamelinensis TaxID=332168 RepID=UPI000B08B811|nr:hypothetical protein [Halococcus hamelinensis]